MLIHDIKNFVVIFSLDVFPVKPRFAGCRHAYDNASVTLHNYFTCCIIFLSRELIAKRSFQPGSPTIAATSVVEPSVVVKPSPSSSPASSSSVIIIIIIIVLVVVIIVIVMNAKSSWRA